MTQLVASPHQGRAWQKSTRAHAAKPEICDMRIASEQPMHKTQASGSAVPWPTATVPIHFIRRPRTRQRPVETRPCFCVCFPYPSHQPSITPVPHWKAGQAAAGFLRTIGGRCKATRARQVWLCPIYGRKGEHKSQHGQRLALHVRHGPSTQNCANQCEPHEGAKAEN